MTSGRLQPLLRAPDAAIAFTLVELLLVMAMLSIVLAVTAPSLSRFFRGRNLDSEARRFLALTRYAQSRAASEGIPMILWLDINRKIYGLGADSSYVEQDTKEVEYPLGSDLELQVVQAPASKRLTTVWKGNGRLPANVAKIYFMPDGSIGESSPDVVLFRGKDEGVIQIETTLNRMNYAIQSNRTQLLYR